MEKRYVSPEIAERKYAAAGLMIFIFNDKNEVFVLKEKQTTKTHNEGDKGVPCETKEKGEKWQDCLRRVFEEEFGISWKDVCGMVYFNPESVCVRQGGSMSIGEDESTVLATTLKLYCSQPDKLIELAKKNDEVETVGWRSLSYLRGKQDLRQDVWRVMEESILSGTLSKDGSNFDVGKMVSLNEFSDEILV